jgi:hypothetical protein
MKCCSCIGADVKGYVRWHNVFYMACIACMVVIEQHVAGRDENELH